MEIITTIMTDPIMGSSVVFEKVTTALYTNYYIDNRKIDRKEYYRVYDVLLLRGYAFKIYRERS